MNSGYRHPLLLAVLASATFQAMAQSAAPQAASAAVVQRELIYCADLMTHEEREAYRARMQAARTAEDKAALRGAHRLDMQQRARAAGREGQCEPAGPQFRGGASR